jgi:hypothetical protein
MTPVRRLVATTVAACSAALGAAACTAEAPVASGPPTSTVQATPAGSSPTATDVATEAASPSPSATPAPSPITGWGGTVFNRPEAPSTIAALATNGTVVVAAGGSATEGAVWILRSGADWERATGVPATPQGEIISLTDVAAFGTGFAAVGVVGAPQGEPFASVIWASDDGRTWREVRRLSGELLHGVIAGGPGLIAMGGRGPAVGYPSGVALWTSADGETWTQASGLEPLGASAFEDAVSADAGLIAVGQSRDDPSAPDISAAVWTSADGTAWTRVSSGPLFATSVMNAIATSGLGLVAVGQDYGPAGGHPVVWTSADGTAWERPPFDVAAGGLNGAAGTDGALAIAGSVAGPDDLHPAVWTSLDAATWTAVPEVPEQGTGFLNDVLAVDDRLIAAGSTIGPTPDETLPLVLNGPLPE